VHIRWIAVLLRNLYIGCNGDGNDKLSVAIVSIAGDHITRFANKVVLGDTARLLTISKP
jgi:hypothetical protein